MANDPHPQTARLEAIIGAWRTEGEVLGEDGESVVQTFSGSDTYEWLGRFFVIHRVDVLFGENHVENLEMIGPYESQRGAFLTAVYDGARTEVEHSIATVDDAGVWTFRAGEGPSRAQSSIGSGDRALCLNRKARFVPSTDISAQTRPTPTASETPVIVGPSFERASGRAC